MTEDWLEIGETDPDEAVHDMLTDEVSLAERYPVAPLGVPEHHAAIIVALKRLQWRQRMYIRAFLEGGCTKRGAAGVLNSWRKKVPDDATVWRWQRTSKYVEALNLVKRHYAELAGLDRDSVLIKTGHVLDDAMEPKDVLDREGLLTGVTQINGNVAMRALEFAGKVNGMIKPEDMGSRVTFVVNIANREELSVVSDQ